ncbi:hypothetical protein ACEWY4_015169 [Coilia grayii]|uniref:Gypsy retrotransposon integrase-like protein 1 n=1 Tax=Coilia grayii TaxID=363190 RepID=A0ABD1JNM5_9TELE
MSSDSIEVEDVENRQEAQRRSVSERTVERNMAFGKPEDFHFEESEESFDSYCERLEQYFAANGLDTKDEKTRAVFLTVVGKRAHSLLMDLCAPEKPSAKTYEDLVGLLRKHYVPKTNFIAERCKFHGRNQKENETISEYIASLRKLAATCKFGTFLDEALRDRFVCGVKSTELRDRLLNAAHTKDLILPLAIEMALAFEVTKDSAQQFSHKTYKANVVDKKAGMRHSGKTEKLKVGEKPCYRCSGKGHRPEDCRFKETVCHECKKQGHIAKACRSRQEGGGKQFSKAGEKKSCNALKHETCRGSVALKQQTDHNCNAPQHDRGRDSNAPQHSEGGDAIPVSSRCMTADVPNIDPGQTMDSEGTDLFAVDSSKGDTVKPYYVYVSVNGARLKMEVDTGAAVSVISESLYKRRFRSLKLSPANCVLKTYSQESLKLMGKFTAKVKCKEHTKKLEVLVVKGKGPALMGRDWISQLKLDWSRVHRVAPETVEDVCARYTSVFKPGLGKVKGIEAKLQVAADAVPKFCKPRNVPYALREAVEKELVKLETEGVISPIKYSEWAAPIVCVPKKGDRVRICGDYKVTINPWLNVEQYPLPRTQDLFAKLAGGQKFTKLDLSQAYQQVQLEEKSRRYLTINTHKGLYHYNRLPYGVASAPAIFQKLMDQVLQGMDGVICYLDDILITGKDTECHLTNLEEVLRRLESYNLRVQEEKCEFMKSSVSYLGHVIDAMGIHPMKEKTDAIQRAAVPKNVTELRSFLALLNYYGKFIPNLSTMIQPMTALLHKDVTWEWSEKCQGAFDSAKKSLQSDKLLVHYDPDLPLILACDASPYGVGAVISHKMKDGSERPIAFASRMLTKTEQNYSQIEKEALGLVFGVVKFHEYLFGRKFLLLTDHKPLLKILGPKTGVPTLAAARMQRWALILAAYTYEIQYKRSEQHSNADALSRLPVKPNVDVVSNPVYRVSYLEDLPITAREIAKETDKDPVLKVVKQLILTGWPKHVQDELLKPYFQRKFELTIEDDCVLWGFRVVVPEKLRDRLLSELHEHHWGIVKMKSLARSLFWWPLLDESIEREVSECSICQQQRSMPAAAPVHTWKWASSPWERIHLDFAEDHKQMFLVVMDAYARWPDIIPMHTTTSAKTIEALRILFAAYGLPKEVVTDNGPQFVSDEFETFLSRNGVKHIKSPAYHPASNGLAERLVQNLKKSLAKNRAIGGMTLDHCVANFLFGYRNTPHTTTGKTPAELFLRRQVRNRLSLIKPEFFQRMQSETEPPLPRVRSFIVGQQVLVKNYRGGEKWLNGVICEVLGPVTYMVEVNGKCVKRHVNQMLSTKVKPAQLTQVDSCTGTCLDFDEFNMDNDEKQQSVPLTVEQQHREPPPPVMERNTRPVRNRRPPDRLNLQLQMQK